MWRAILWLVTEDTMNIYVVPVLGVVIGYASRWVAQWHIKEMIRKYDPAPDNPLG